MSAVSVDAPLAGWGLGIEVTGVVAASSALLAHAGPLTLGFDEGAGCGWIAGATGAPATGTLATSAGFVWTVGAAVVVEFGGDCAMSVAGAVL